MCALQELRPGGLGSGGGVASTSVRGISDLGGSRGWVLHSSPLRDFGSGLYRVSPFLSVNFVPGTNVPRDDAVGASGVGKAF